METRLLYYFLTVAKEKNITKSAELLHITQPTLSRQLTQLEESIGQQLLIRGKKGIQLTEAGKLFERRAQDILDLIDKTTAELNYEEELVGTISIGTADCQASNELLSQLVSHCQKQYPHILFDFYCAEAKLVIEKLNQGLIDIGLLLEPVDLDGFDYIRLPFKEKWGIMINADHPLSKKDVLHPQDLIDIPLFFNMKRVLIQDEIRHWAQDYYKDYHFIGSFNLSTNMTSFIEKNLGAALCVEGTSANQYYPQIKFVPIEPPIYSNTVIAWKKNRPQTAIMKKIIELFNEMNK
ncbi:MULTISPECIES: LysR family transcriptional regulator [Coprobacillaceae]|uniref:LysR family transcriptional regulator n=1 Tax=Coprobacillaceae TaxID=2810280 RepID=UPI000E46F678|nr:MULTISPECIES: LysR family transcriptional regulator [Coprobacillaceae]RHM63131.1 LysR family transcriptional regulator [Coprobacillus sp. AF33-1AC]RHS93220.1 LysR family transcriptional regulator [Erysipelatoclostridium sp. AM42-17]